MSPLRRTISMVIALILLVGGLGSMIYLLVFAAGWKGWMVMASGAVAAAGVMWLYDDFINATPNKT